jgi:hypothetical protein
VTASLKITSTKHSRRNNTSAKNTCTPHAHILIRPHHTKTPRLSRQRLSPKHQLRAIALISASLSLIEARAWIRRRKFMPNRKSALRSLSQPTRFALRQSGM